MIVCPSCSAEDPDTARFCHACGAGLEAPQAPAREERKVVTVLFADLVGFTARAEQLDPEDVRGLLAPYHAHLREELAPALAFWREVGETRYVREGEVLLAESA
jgi:hypothetical protein